MKFICVLVAALILLPLSTLAAPAEPQGASAATQAENIAYGKRFGYLLRWELLHTALHGQGVVIVDFVVGPTG